MIRMKTDMIIDIVMKYIRIESVRLLSITSMSLENRLVMRPSGVVSKNDIGARRTRLIARWSMTLPAWVPYTERESEKTNRSKAWTNPRAAYTPIYNC